MTIKQAAEQYGISVQAIYSRLKKESIMLETLKDAETGELTADAEVVFAKLFDKEKRNGSNFNSSLQRLKAAQEEIIRLNQEKSDLIERVKQLEIDKAELKEEKERLMEIAQQAQELHKTALERMLPPAKEETEGQARRGGVLGWLFGRR